MAEPNALDRLIGYLSPRAGAQRLAYRRAQKVRNYYDGATRSHRAASWQHVGASDPNTPIRTSIERLRNVSRDMCRNNSYAARARQAITANVIGDGIIPSVEAKGEQNRRRFEDLLKAHFDTTSCDVAGANTLYGLQQMAMQAVVESGEVIIRKRIRRPSEGLPLPFQIEVLEADYLDSQVDGEQPGGTIAIQGIEYDSQDRVVAYHLFDFHPSDHTRYNATSRRVPADFVAHIFRRDRPGQNRGVPWLAPVIVTLQDLQGYRGAQLVRQKIAACFAAFVTSDDVGWSELDETTRAGLPVDQFEPGMIERLNPGDSVSFASPPAVSDYSQFQASTLREVAAGLGISYESLTGDYSQVNFSSSRMGWLEFSRNISAWQFNMFIPSFCETVERWFFEAAGLTGSQRSARDPVKLKWTPPRREMVSPKDEIPALVAAVDAMFMSRSEVIRRMGYDPEDVDQEIADEKEREEELGIAPVAPVAPGAPGEEAPGGEQPPPDNDDDPEGDETEDEDEENAA